MATLIERQIDDWQKRGVIDGDTAGLLLADVATSVANPTVRKPSRFSFFQVLIVFAAISFVAGIALLIASNWEVIPRLVRVGGVLSLIVAGLIGRVFVHGRSGPRSRYAEEACYMIAGGAFLSVIALVAQMYHISGDERDAALIYTAGLGFGAVAVRSVVLTGGALYFWGLWHLEGPHADNWLSWQFWAYFAVLAAAFFVARRWGSKWAKWMVLAAAVVGTLPLAIRAAEWMFDRLVEGVEWFFDLPDGIRIAVWLVLLTFSVGALFFAHWFNPRVESGGDKRRVPVWLAFVVGLVALVGLHEFADNNAVAFILAGAVIIFVLLTLFLHGQGHQIVRYVCYAAFLIEILYLYTETISSMVSTSGFLILLAGFLIVVALAIYQFERRFRAPPEEEGA